MSNNKPSGETLCELRVTRHRSSRWRWRSPIWNRMTSLLIGWKHRRDGRTMVSIRTPYLMRDLIHRMKTKRGQGISHWDTQPKLPYTDATAYALTIGNKKERFKAGLSEHERMVKPILHVVDLGSLKPWWARYLSEREESAYVEVNRKESNARYRRENQKPQWRLNSDPRFWWREYTIFKLTSWQGWTQREPCTFPGLIWRLFAQPASPTKRQVILNCIQGRDHFPGRLTLASIAARIVTSNTLKVS